MNVSYLNNVQYIQNNLELHDSINNGAALEGLLTTAAEQ